MPVPPENAIKPPLGAASFGNGVDSLIAAILADADSSPISHTAALILLLM